ncbi:MAG: histidine kinase [Algibacter sp.]
MKKIFLIIVLITPLFLRMINSSNPSLLVQVEENDVSKREKNINWEYVKDKLFEGKINRTHTDAKKFLGPILIALNNPTEKDILAVKSILEDLKEVIPHKTVSLFSSFTKYNFSEFTKDKTLRDIQIEGYSYSEIVASVLKINFETNEYRNKKGANTDTKSLYFSFKKDTKIADRKKHIQYELLRTLCFIKTDNNSFLNITYPTEAIFNDPTYTILDKEFTDIDNFLIQKLYADNFENQFSNYMYKTYPWRYANLFVNKKIAFLKVYVLIGLMGLLVFILAFTLFNTKKTKYLDYMLPVTVVFFGLLNLQGIYSYFINIQLPSYTLKTNIIITLYVLASALIVSFLLYIIEQKIINKIIGFTYQFVMKLVITFIALQLPLLLGYFLIGNINKILLLYTPLFFVLLTLTLGRGLLIYLNYFSESLVLQKDIELNKLKALNAKNELKSLHAHINPHFLYNALNSIAGLMHESTSKAEDMIVSLSDLFRYSINRKEKQMSTIADEVTMVENYLKIENIRFEERLQFTINADAEILNKDIPMYILQPLIENAIKHGISDMKTAGNIHLDIIPENQNIKIIVSDNGVDFPEDMYSGYGLQSVYDLLRLSYGDQASLNWTNTPRKSISILIPSAV